MTTEVTGTQHPGQIADLVQQISHDAGTRFTETDLANVLERLMSQQQAGAQSHTLTAEEEAFLDTYSGTEADPKALLQTRIYEAITTDMQARAMLTVNQAAARLGVSPSRVRHRIREGSLYAAPSSGRGTERRLPRWQFIDDRAIPHLKDVLAALPDEYTPLDVKAFFDNATIDSPTTGEPVPIREWLDSGHQPSPVIALAHDQRYTL